MMLLAVNQLGVETDTKKMAALPFQCKERLV
jgi:hypothetical protein